MANDYNGWENWATWQVNLWASNDEPTYRTMRSYRPYTALDAERVTRRELFPNGTPDMDGAKDLDAVNWDEIAEAWSEE